MRWIPQLRFLSVSSTKSVKKSSETPQKALDVQKSNKTSNDTTTDKDNKEIKLWIFKIFRKEVL